MKRRVVILNIVVLSVLLLFSSCGHSHSWTEATCTDPRTCSKCGETEGSPLGHDYEKEIISDASCLESGILRYTCKRCSYSFEEVIPAFGHEKEILKRVEPGCTTSGYESAKCARCGYDYGLSTIPPLGHDEGEVQVIKEPTCTEKGEGEIYCIRCSEKIRSVELDKLPHDYNDAVVIKAPTCSSTGLSYHRCRNCTHLEYITVPALSHTEAKTLVKSPTCSEEGMYYVYCTVCRKHLRDESIPTTPHPELKERTAKEPTCSSYGILEWYCTLCSNVAKTEDIAKLPHTPAERRIEPTCTEAGANETYCTVCGEVISSTPIEKKPHTEGETRTIKESECISYRVTYCALCNGVIRNEKITAHSYDAYLYSDLESKKRRCTVCGLFFGSGEDENTPEITLYLNSFEKMDIYAVEIEKDDGITDDGVTLRYSYYIDNRNNRVELRFHLEGKDEKKTSKKTGDLKRIKAGFYRDYGTKLETEDEYSYIILGSINDVVPFLNTSSIGNFTLWKVTLFLSGLTSDDEIGAVVKLLGWAGGTSGGLVFYDRGYREDGWRFIETAPTDIESAKWGNPTTSYKTSLEPGTGKSNTELIKGTAIAMAVSQYDEGGKSDWFIPSWEELRLMYNVLHKNGLGAFSPKRYWSSSARLQSSAYWLDFTDGTEGGDKSIPERRTNTYSVRPVRSF